MNEQIREVVAQIRARLGSLESAVYSKRNSFLFTAASIKISNLQTDLNELEAALNKMYMKESKK